MSVNEAIESVDEQYGIFSQCEVVYADDNGDVMLAPKDADCLYDQTDFEFLQDKVRELVEGSLAA